ncbi:hypothetical protein [Bradyrhizobium genosp. A]|uniref:hypothetical protein n=1 Tax=Bradyrhizobium genosp. A TaxID=83626 RepID=UPI003CEB8F11
MRQQRPRTSGALLDPLMAKLGEATVAGHVKAVKRILDVVVLFSGRVGPIEVDELGCHLLKPLNHLKTIANAPVRIDIGVSRCGNQRVIVCSPVERRKPIAGIRDGSRRVFAGKDAA